MEIFGDLFIGWRWKKRWKELAQRLGVQCDERKIVRTHESKVRSVLSLGAESKRETVMMLEGQYRNHSIVLEAYKTYTPRPKDDRSEGGWLPVEHQYSRFSVQIAKITDFKMSVSRKGFFGKVLGKLGAQDIKLANREFDKKFMVRGDNEDLIKNMLDINIQSQIMSVNNFPGIKIENGEAIFQAEHFTRHIDRLHSLIDVTIDIVEKIEGLEDTDIPYGIPVTEKEFDFNKKKRTELKGTGPFK